MRIEAEPWWGWHCLPGHFSSLPAIPHCQHCYQGGTSKHAPEGVWTCRRGPTHRVSGTRPSSKDHGKPYQVRARPGAYRS